MKIENLGTFLARYADDLLHHVARAFPPVVREPCELPPLLRSPLGRQALAIGAAKRALEEYNAAIVVGEMGSGKSFVAAATAAATASRTLVVCPPHLVEKWREEIEMTVPDARVVIAETITDLERARQLANEPHLFVVMSRERAKLGAPLVNSGIRFQHNLPRCVHCGQIYTKPKTGVPPSPEEAKKLQRPVCPNCKTPLYAPDPERSRRRDGSVRYPLAEYVKRRMPRFFDLLVLDEAHEYKAANSAQGIAAGILSEVVPRTMILTGTLFGGYASTLFYLLWRFVRPFRQHFGYDEVKKFVETYGAVEKVEVTYHDQRGVTTRRGNLSVRTKEIPATSPMLLYFLLPVTVFMKLADVAGGLPPYYEEVETVPMSPELDAWYQDLLNWFNRQDLRNQPELLGAFFHATVFGPDTATYGFEVKDHLQHRALEEDLLPKEERLLEIVDKERTEGRRVIVFVQNTGTRNLAARLERLLNERGFRAKALYAHTTSARKREAWIRDAVRDGLDVLILHPRIVQTGLDLIDFPTLVYYQVEPSVYVLRQAARRSWRIGQKHPVAVIHLVYEDTLQEKALALLANKAQASLALEGHLTDQGLNSIANNDTSLSLARALVETGSTSFDPNLVKIATLGIQTSSQRAAPKPKPTPTEADASQSSSGAPAPLDLPTAGELEEQGIQLRGRRRPPPREAPFLFPELLMAS